MSAAHQHRKHSRHPEGSSWMRFWWVGLILGAVLVAMFAFLLRPNRGVQRPLAGYIAGIAAIQEEYVKYYGKPFHDPDVVQQLDQTNALIAKHDYVGAAAQLEVVAKAVAVPVVFNNLGVLYAEMNDRSRCLYAFREALARDTAYRPVRQNLDRLRGFTADSADPVTHEIEPNDNNTLSNIIGVNTPVDGTIAKGLDDVDCYRVHTPPAPRDILSIEIVSHSKELMPSLRLYDVNLRLTDLGRTVTQPGGSLSLLLAPQPNTTLYLQVLGAQESTGEYTLLVKPSRAFDVYEPNDDIFNARRVEVGQTIDANIMDNQDTDFFSFVAPRDGIIVIEIHNRSGTLVPALTTFTPDQRNSGFGPNVRNPGADLRHAIPVQEHQVYYLQVWAQGDSSGDYSLTLK